jgi:hypothetical protein
MNSWVVGMVVVVLVSLLVIIAVMAIREAGGKPLPPNPRPDSAVDETAEVMERGQRPL